MDTHQDNTGRKAETVVADSKYGTIDNYRACYGRGVKAHIPDLKKKQDNRGTRKGIYSEDRFTYDTETETYLCPAGKILKPRALHKKRQSREYGASKKECAQCELRPHCTRSKTGRTIKRHLHQDELDHIRALAETAASKRDIKTRQHLVERTFARAKRYGSDRARWRGLWRVQIQEYIIASIQNIQVLMGYGKNPLKRAANAMSPIKKERNRRIYSPLLIILLQIIRLFKTKLQFNPYCAVTISSSDEPLTLFGQHPVET